MDLKLSETWNSNLRWKCENGDIESLILSLQNCNRRLVSFQMIFEVCFKAKMMWLCSRFLKCNVWFKYCFNGNFTKWFCDSRFLGCLWWSEHVWYVNCKMFEWLFDGKSLKCSKLQVGVMWWKWWVLVILVKIQMDRVLASFWVILDVLYQSQVSLFIERVWRFDALVLILFMFYVGKVMMMILLMLQRCIIDLGYPLIQWWIMLIFPQMQQQNLLCVGWSTNAFECMWGLHGLFWQRMENILLFT